MGIYIYRAVVGLRLSSGIEDLALLYLATVQALAYQTKHIIDACEEAGHAPITSIFVTGGLVKNPVYLQAHADVTGCPLEIPSEPEAVLLGVSQSVSQSIRRAGRQGIRQAVN